MRWCGSRWPGVGRRELHTPDPSRSAAFYADWFGWRAEPDAAGWALRSDEGVEGWVRIAGAGEVPHWRLFFSAPAPALARATGLGARVLVRDGAAVWLADPSDAEFGLLLA